MAGDARPDIIVERRAGVGGNGYQRLYPLDAADPAPAEALDRLAAWHSLGMAMSHQQQVLVPGRECGACDVCCVVLQIDTAEIQKPSGDKCRHCLPDGGCGIHQARPPVCAGFYCAWRVLDILGPDWRPDKSGVFAQLET